MGNVILVNSGKTSGEGSNFGKTIGRGIDLSEINGYVTRETYDSLERIYGDGKTYIWGLKQKIKLDKTKVGDHMWFCSDNNYHTFAEVVYIEQENVGLSNHLWGTKKYPYIVFVNGIEKTNVTRGEVQVPAGLSSEYKLFSAHPLNAEESSNLLPLLKDTEKKVKELLETVTLDIEAQQIEEGNIPDGEMKQYYTKHYERNPKNRTSAIKKHGVSCKACGFNFEKAYGEHGKDFIEVHHIKPLSTLDKAVVIDPEVDLIPLCANCHRMVHRKKDQILSIEDLIKLVNREKQ